MPILRTPALPARFYATPEYREGYAVGALAAHSEEDPKNPYLPYDLHHLGWADACYDTWSTRRIGPRRGHPNRPESLRVPAAGPFAS